jgi:hypothetical protein
MMARHSRSANAQTLSQRLVARILALPRLARVLLVGLFALAVTLSLSPLVDYIYIEYFFNMDTRILPALVSAAVGLGIYVLGW